LTPTTLLVSSSTSPPLSPQKQKTPRIYRTFVCHHTETQQKKPKKTTGASTALKTFKNLRPSDKKLLLFSNFIKARHLHLTFEAKAKQRMVVEIGGWDLRHPG